MRVRPRCLRRTDSSLAHLTVPLLVCLLLAVTGCDRGGHDQRPSGDTPSIEGTDRTAKAELLSAMSMYQFPNPVKAPDFELESVKGERLTLSPYRGKAVLLSFWVTW